MEIGCESTAQLTSSAAVTTVACLVWAISFKTSSDAGSITIKDGGSDGTVKWVLNGKTTAAGDDTVSIAFAKPIICATDCYATIGGTGAGVNIAYEKLV